MSCRNQNRSAKSFQKQRGDFKAHTGFVQQQSSFFLSLSLSLSLSAYLTSPASEIPNLVSDHRLGIPVPKLRYGKKERKKGG
jgi:hypothetical protein